MDAVFARVIDEAEARQLPSVIAEWTDAPDVRRWIARALQIDLPLLTERPELAMPCLVRRCFALGDARESLFLAYPRKPPPESRELRELVGAAATEWRPGRRWLRAVRSPHPPLDAGVIEEYRTALGGRLGFSADGSVIGVIGPAGVIGWERSTGRRAIDPAIAIAPHRWRVADDSTWGRFVFVSGDRRVEIEPHVEERAGIPYLVAPDFAIAGLTDSDYDHFHAGIDLASGRITWRHRGDCAFAVPYGDHVLIAQDDRVVKRVVRTGELAGEWFAPEVSELAIAPDGTVATRSGSVIRVWDVETALAVKLASRPVRGWIDAQFSPDGQRLLTGGLLCNGRDGDLLAVLDVDGPGYLEGGPPAHCQRITNARLVEIGPFGLHLWDARTGAVQADHREIRATLGDTVAFDPRGLYMAIAFRHRRLEVWGLAPVARLFARDVDELEREGLGWSPDGDLLWWRCKNGERWVFPIADPSSTAVLAAHEPVPEERALVVPVADGLLERGDVAIPIDDRSAVRSRDGRAFASRTSHYILEG